MVRGAERSCRARGNYSQFYQYFWYQGEPEKTCARKHGVKRLGICRRLECVITGTENTRDRPNLQGLTIHWNTIVSDTHGGQDGGLCRKPVLRNFLPNPVLVCSGFTANNHERQVVSVS